MLPSNFTFLRFVHITLGNVFEMPEKERGYMDLTFCIEGEMVYFKDGERIELHSGDAVLFPPNSLRSRLKGDIPTSYISFNIFPPDDFIPLIDGYLKDALCEEIAYSIDTFEKEWHVLTPHRQERCYAIFSYIYYHLTDSACDTEKPHVKKIKQYVMDNLSSSISLDDIANHVHLAPQYICTLFKANVGMTVTEFITDQRIDLAKRLIITGTAPLYEISEQCGFTDYNYFSHTFKKITGISAASFRKLKPHK